MLDGKHTSFRVMIEFHRDPSGETNMKKPFKKHRQPLDEFYYQEFAAQPQRELDETETKQVERTVGAYDDNNECDSS